MLNKWKKFIFFGFSLTLLSVVTVNAAQNGFYYSEPQNEEQHGYFFSEPQNEEQREFKEEMDLKLKQKFDHITKKASEKYNVPFETMSKIELNEKLIKENKEFTELYSQVLRTLEVGDSKPMLYLKDNQGYFIVEKASGEIKLYHATEDNGKWTLKNK